MTKFSIALQTDKKLADYGPLAAMIEAYGFDGVSVYNDLLYQPAWLPLLEIARATQHIRLGPAAVNPFTSHPLTIAGNIALIDEASAGRAYLGVARGAWLDFLGIKPRAPISAVIEAIGSVQHLLAQKKEAFNGRFFSLAGGASLRWSLRRPDVPILLGSWGPQLLQRAAPLVSEVKLGGSANPDLIGWVRQQVAAARPSPQIVLGAVTVVDEDGAAAKALAKREVALYLPVVAGLDRRVTVEPERLAGIRAATAAYDFAGAATFISDELLQKFAFAGTPAALIAQVEALQAAGVDRIEFGTPHGKTAVHGIKLLAETVLPVVQ